MNALPFSLDRTVLIRATPEIVFRYFTDSTRWARWWGAGSSIDARPGGTVLIRMGGNVEAGGSVVEVSAPHRIIFTYGFASGTPMPVGSTRVTIELTPVTAGTRLTLTHELDNASVRDEHTQGWRYQLSVFSNVVSDEVTMSAASAIDGWFATWAEKDPAARGATLARIAEPTVTFHDRYSNLETFADIQAHVTAAQHFMPNVILRRSGEIRQCQGTALADWTVDGPDGSVAMAGTNVFTFGPTGLIASVVGVAATPALRGTRS